MVAALLLLLYRVRAVLPVFILSFIIAYMLDPLLDRLQHWGWSRGRAVFFVCCWLLLFFLLGVLFLLPPLTEQVTNLMQNWGRFQDKLVRAVGGFEAWLVARHAPAQVIDQLRDSWQLLAKQGVRIAPRVAAWVVDSTTGLLVLSFLVPILTIYFMLDIDPMKLRILSLVPVEYRTALTTITSDINGMLGRYLRGQAVVSTLVALATLAALQPFRMVYGMEFSLLLALISGATYVVPFVGATLAAVLASVVGYVTADHHSLTCAVLVLIVLPIVNQFFDSLVTPRIVGKQVGLHPLFVIFALMAGGHMFGLIGMLIAVPAAASIKVILIKAFPQLTSPLPEIKEGKLPSHLAWDQDVPPSSQSPPADRPEETTPADMNNED